MEFVDEFVKANLEELSVKHLKKFPEEFLEKFLDELLKTFVRNIDNNMMEKHLEEFLEELVHVLDKNPGAPSGCIPEGTAGTISDEFPKSFF